LEKSEEKTCGNIGENKEEEKYGMEKIFKQNIRRKHKEISRRYRN